jgi:hypothetical protein
MTIPSTPAPGRDVVWPPRLEACRIQEIYRPSPGPADKPRTSVAQMLAAVIGAYHGGTQDEPLILAWHRPAAGAEVTILSATSAGDGPWPAPLVFPPGSRGTPADGALERLCGLPAWIPIGLGPDPGAPTGPALPQETGVSLEDGLLGAWPGSFAWLLLANRVCAAEARTLATKAATAADAARNFGPAASAHALEAQAHTRRHRELTRGQATGLWRIHLLAGAADEGSARAVAGLLTAATDLSSLGYSPAPIGPATPLPEALNATRQAESGHVHPQVAGSPLLAALIRLPQVEIHGIRMIPRATFDVTAELPAYGSEHRDIELGTVLDRDGRAAGPLRIRPETLNRHTFVCGATGAGKSQTVRTLLEELSTSPEPVPWLVIEPAKAEYARMAGRLAGRGEVLVIRPGQLDAVPGCINPLEPEPGFPLQTHIDLVRALFLAAFEAVEPFPQVLAHALGRCYRELGWDVTLGEPRGDFRPRYPTLGDLQRTALHVVEEIGYGDEITADVRGFIDVRIGSLRLGTPGRFFEGGHPLDIGELMSRNTVLELEDIGNDQDKAFFIGAILIRIAEHLRTRAAAKPSGQLAHVTVIEEAHRLLKRAERGSPAAHAVEMFAGLLAEIRAYGEGIVVAEQIPSKITPDVLKNSALKIVHRLPAHDDRQAVGATMNLTDEQSRHLVTLPPGHAAVFADGMDNAVLASMPLREAREDARTARHNPETDRRRSVACGTECSIQPCTLRQIARAGHLAEDPELTLWIEMLTMTHLVGQPSPQPDAHWLDEVKERARDPRTLQCAIAHRIQAAIDSRYTGLAAHYPPETLARHLTDATSATLLGLSSCDRLETQWQAGTFRWADVYDALLAAPPEDPHHPDTPLWRRRGLILPGKTIGEQITALDRNPATWKPAPAVIRGNADVPAYESAAGELDDNPEPVDRLARAIGFLHLPDTEWISTALYPQAEPEEPENV